MNDSSPSQLPDSQLPGSQLARSPHLMSRDDTAVLIVDVQDRLIQLIPGQRTVIWNLARLLDGAQILGLPIRATEQYPEKLGETVADVAARIPSDRIAKLRFSCGECGEMVRQLANDGVTNILVAGIETHVCILQTVLDLLTDGFDVYVPVDAVAARRTIDHQTALSRMQLMGATLTTTETALFEWCEVAGTPEFKEISSLIRQSEPT